MNVIGLQAASLNIFKNRPYHGITDPDPSLFFTARLGLIRVILRYQLTAISIVLWFKEVIKGSLMPSFMLVAVLLIACCLLLFLFEGKFYMIFKGKKS
jgi:hypothetical protein